MRFIYPPRPESKIAANQLPVYEKRGIYLVQRKYRGSRSPVNIDKDGNVELYTRHGGKYKKYKPPASLIRQIQGLNLTPGKEYTLDGELMHQRGEPSIDDTMIFYDVLVYEDEYLMGYTTEQRLKILQTICRDPKEPVQFHTFEPPFALRVSDQVWMAQSWTEDFSLHFQEMLDCDLIEGVVVKERNAPLLNFGEKEYHIKWQIRCRKPGPNYQL